MDNEQYYTPEGMKPERRKNRERRMYGDRRSTAERRNDVRENGQRPRRSLRVWLRSKTKARLGVDRRKGDRRRIVDRRTAPRSILTQDEIHDLLSS